MRGKREEKVAPIGPDCGPHCIAQTVGLAQLVVRHCEKCHDEAEYTMRVRPKH